MRTTCPNCNSRPVAINCHKNGKTYYRKLCDSCRRNGVKSTPKPPEWYLSGYRKKSQCEQCGFRFKIPEQSTIFYVDGDLKNNNWANLKTICLNCQCSINILGTGWKKSPLTPDF